MHRIAAASLDDPQVLAMLAALTSELAESGYSAEETFGYSTEQLVESGVHLFGVHADGELVGIGGIELQDAGRAELKRMYVVAPHRGTGAADALVTALLEHARAHDVVEVRLETGDKQNAAIAFYRRHGFVVVPRFGPYVTSATSVCMSRTLD